MQVILILVASSWVLSFAWKTGLCNQKVRLGSQGKVSQFSTSKRFPLKLYDSNSSDKLVYDVKTGRFYERNLEEICDDEFCLVDSETGTPILLTREEKERIFLDSIQSYYFTGAAKITDSEFDKLREDLSWEGSALVTLSRNETLFMNAMQAYIKGNPILSDQQFDDLKLSLKNTNSKLAVTAAPKCYVDTGVCKVSWTPDKLKQTTLYLPAALIGVILWEGLLYELLEPFKDFNPLFSLLLGWLPIQAFSQKVTEEVVFKNPMVSSGPCPSCGVDNTVFFGDVLGVEGDMEESSVTCKNCKCSLTIKRATLRVSTLPTSKQAGPPKPKPQVQSA